VCTASGTSGALIYETSDRMQQIVLGEDFVMAAPHVDEDRGAIACDAAGKLVDGRSGLQHGKRRTHDFAHEELAEVFALERQIQNGVLVERAHGLPVVKHR
jgi:hypothetical protein